MDPRNDCPHRGAATTAQYLSSLMAADEWFPQGVDFAPLISLPSCIPAPCGAQAAQESFLW